MHDRYLNNAFFAWNLSHRQKCYFKLYQITYWPFTDTFFDWAKHYVLGGCSLVWLSTIEFFTFKKKLLIIQNHMWSVNWTSTSDCTISVMWHYKKLFYSLVLFVKFLYFYSAIFKKWYYCLITWCSFPLISNNWI